MNELDAPGADAGVEQRLVRTALAPAHPADVAGVGYVVHHRVGCLVIIQPF